MNKETAPKKYAEIGSKDKTIEASLADKEDNEFSMCDSPLAPWGILYIVSVDCLIEGRKLLRFIQHHEYGILVCYCLLFLTAIAGIKIWYQGDGGGDGPATSQGL
jgi:hypothetical protein